MKKSYYAKNSDLLAELYKVKLSFCQVIDAEPPELITDQPIETISCDRPMIVRVMTYAHIPRDSTRRRKPVGIAKTNFPPFVQWRLAPNVDPVMTVKSHHNSAGEFSIDHGQISNQMVRYWQQIINGMARKPNFSGYSWIEEMRSAAMLGLLQNGLSFDEAKSKNPFSYWSQCVHHSFVRFINCENKQRETKDSLRIACGLTPSWHAQDREKDHD